MSRSEPALRMTLWVEPPPAARRSEYSVVEMACQIRGCDQEADYIVHNDRRRTKLRAAVCGKHLALFREDADLRGRVCKAEPEEQ